MKISIPLHHAAGVSALPEISRIITAQTYPSPLATASTAAGALSVGRPVV
jgi:hypothetical protein